MTDSTKNTSRECAEFQEQLPDFFDTGADLTDHPHLATCENCSALVRDLEYIAAQAKLLLPIHDPSPEVWKNINNALSKEPQHRNAGNDEENS